MKIRWMFLFLAALMALSLSLAIACGGGGDDDDDDDDAVDDDDDDSDDDDADDDDDDDDDDSDDDDDDDDDDAEPTFCNTENSPPGDWTVEFYSVDGDDETMKVKPYVFSEEEEIQVHLTYTDPDCGEEVGGMNGGALIIETPENPLPGNEHSVLVKFATGEDEDAPVQCPATEGDPYISGGDYPTLDMNFLHCDGEERTMYVVDNCGEPSTVKKTFSCTFDTK